MAGRAYEPRFLFMYPNSKISVMGGEQAANVLITVKEDQLKAQGKKLSPEEREKMMQTILKKYEIRDEVELVLEEESILLKPVVKPRKGWEQQFLELHENKEDELLVPGVFTDENLEEWN